MAFCSFDFLNDHKKNQKTVILKIKMFPQLSRLIPQLSSFTPPPGSARPSCGWTASPWSTVYWSSWWRCARALQCSTKSPRSESTWRCSWCSSSCACCGACTMLVCLYEIFESFFLKAFSLKNNLVLLWYDFVLKYQTGLILLAKFALIRITFYVTGFKVFKYLIVIF